MSNEHKRNNFIAFKMGCLGYEAIFTDLCHISNGIDIS